MFLCNDTFTGRHEQIRSLDPCMGVILAAADFEWTVRRAILALGVQPTKDIQQNVLSKISGLNGYRDAWKKEVVPYTGKQLPDLVPNWDFFQKEAYPLRDKLVHGKGAVSEASARECMECILAASRALIFYAEGYGETLYSRQIRRMKSR